MARRSSVESVSAPSATLPSSSILAPDSATTPPPISLFARSAKRPKPPNGSSRSSVHRMTSRSDGASRLSVPSILSVGSIARGAVERQFQRRTGEPQLDAGALAGQRGQEIAEREVRFDRLAMPHEAAIGAEAARDRRPGELKVDAVEPPVGGPAGLGVVDDDDAVANADFRERCGAVAVGLQGARERCDQSRPVRLPIRRERHGDGRPYQRHVGDLDPPGEQREVAQVRRQFLGHHGGRAGLVVAEQHVMEAHRARWKQRDRDVAAQHRVEPGHPVNLLADGVPYRGGGNEEGQRDQNDEAHRDDGGNGDRQAFEANSRGHEMRFRCSLGLSAMRDGR